MIDETNKLLREISPEFNFNNPPIDPIQFAKDIAESLMNTSGVGLAANQVGLPHRCFVIRSNPILVMYNPIIVDYSKKEVYMDEGCLSFPNLIIKIKRPEHIRMRFTLPNGEVKTEKYTGMTSRIIQHEYDHLNGIIYTDRATRYHREMAQKKCLKLRKTIW